jgi:hypothetical protein
MQVTASVTVRARRAPMMSATAGLRLCATRISGTILAAGAVRGQLSK